MNHGIDCLNQVMDKKMLEFEKKVDIKVNLYIYKCKLQLNIIEEKLSNIEKKTLWKINECEDNMKKRVTADYVEDAVIALEEKFKREYIN